MTARKKVALVSALVLAATLGAQAILGLKTGQRSSLAWDAPTVNADGSACDDLAGFRAAITAADVDLNSTTPPLPVPLAAVDVPGPTVTETSLSALLSGRDGGDYRLWVLAYDDAGNESEWSEPLLITYDPTKPGKPLNPNVKK